MACLSLALGLYLALLKAFEPFAAHGELVGGPPLRGLQVGVEHRPLAQLPHQRGLARRRGEVQRALAARVGAVDVEVGCAGVRRPSVGESQILMLWCADEPPAQSGV